MRIRIGKLSDAREIAELHMLCSKTQPDGFMHKLGKNFFKAYYSIMLEEKSSVVLCAENDAGKLIGLATGSIDSQEHSTALQKAKLRLAISTLFEVIKSPRLFKELYNRSKLESADSSEEGYIVLKGARLEYWGWDPTEKQTMGAVELLRTWLDVMKRTGNSCVNFEVDESNNKTVRLHGILGSKIIKSYRTPDGRKRLLMQYHFLPVE